MRKSFYAIVLLCGTVCFAQEYQVTFTKDPDVSNVNDDYFTYVVNTDQGSWNMNGLGTLTVEGQPEEITVTSADCSHNVTISNDDQKDCYSHSGTASPTCEYSYEISWEPILNVISYTSEQNICENGHIELETDFIHDGGGEYAWQYRIEDNDWTDFSTREDELNGPTIEVYLSDLPGYVFGQNVYFRATLLDCRDM